MAGYTDIISIHRDGVAYVTVDRPTKLNAYRNETAEQLLGALKRAEDDHAVRALILTGNGRAFGAGYDLSTVEPDSVPELDHVLERYFNPLVAAIRRSRLPVVAAVNGPCAGAAVGIALSADIVIASRSAYFYEPFVGIALVPDAGNTLFLPRIAGRIRASAAMLLGEPISADEAREWGLVWRVVDNDKLQGKADEIAHKLVSLSPYAVAATKQLIEAAADFGMNEQLERERDRQGAAGRTPEMKAAIAAFFASKKN
jgi:2-(1,2-epoxy-1,2-dihydrophenyl)acetyl-CoA isomerase